MFTIAMLASLGQRARAGEMPPQPGQAALPFSLLSKPRLILMIDEDVGPPLSVEAGARGGANGGPGIVERAFAERWRPEEVIVLNRFAVEEDLAPEVQLPPEANEGEVLAWAQEAGAQVVVFGLGHVVDAGRIFGTQKRSLQASVQVRALAVESAAVLGVSSQASVVGHEDPRRGRALALDEAATRAAADLLHTLQVGWSQNADTALSTTLLLHDCRKQSTARRVGEVLPHQVAGVHSVRARGVRKRVARFEIVITGSAAELGAQLAGISFPGFALEMMEDAREQGLSMRVREHAL